MSIPQHALRMSRILSGRGGRGNSLDPRFLLSERLLTADRCPARRYINKDAMPAPPEVRRWQQFIQLKGMDVLSSAVCALRIAERPKRKLPISGWPRLARGSNATCRANGAMLAAVAQRLSRRRCYNSVPTVCKWSAIGPPMHANDTNSACLHAARKGPSGLGFRRFQIKRHPSTTFALRLTSLQSSALADNTRRNSRFAPASAKPT